MARTLQKKVVRFTGSESNAWTRLDEVLVRCPACRACAVIREASAAVAARKPGPGRLYRLICADCGHHDERREHTSVVERPRPAPDTPTDPVFELPYWLQTRCCGHVLWALNAGHLAVIEAYITAGLREDFYVGRVRETRTTVARLPKWMVLARNREKVLRGLKRLRERLETPR